jgi:dextranase
MMRGSVQKVFPGLKVLRAGLVTLFLLMPRPSAGQQIDYEGTESGTYFNQVRTDKSRYAPGDSILLTVDFGQSPAGKSLYVRYRHLFDTVADTTLSPLSSSGYSWTWVPPSTDFSGYLVECFLVDGSVTLDHINIAIDVSSDWRVFPRYGFLSNFGSLTPAAMEAVVARLNRYHINGLQFYDWQFKHHMPLAGTPSSPSPVWTDIANRTTFLETVQGYISEASRRNMTTMAYNLLYGAWADAAVDGAPDDAHLFTDATLQTMDRHMLPSSWASDIFVMDPTNPGWTDYLLMQMSRAFDVFEFDGWHVDQLGDRGTLWNALGQPVVLSETFLPFLRAADNRLGVRLVMNAVNQYGQTGIAQSPVDFLYTEVWDPNDSFAELIGILAFNEEVYDRQTVIAGYMNRDLSDRPGFFNTPGVLLADAVIFAYGSSHIELGEHMLGNEYFPNDNLSMPEELEQNLISYYDFLVAYENWLRGEALVVGANVGVEGIRTVRSPEAGSILTLSREMENQRIYHLLNFTSANTMSWRDNTGTQVQPKLLNDLTVTLPWTQAVSRVWTASPDLFGGSPVELPFVYSGNEISLSLPSLAYWSMIVVEGNEQATGIESPPETYSESHSFRVSAYPNPFNSTITIEFKLATPTFVSLDIFDVLGRNIEKLTEGHHASGTFSYDWNAFNFAPGVYYYRLVVAGKAETGVIIHTE